MNLLARTLQGLHRLATPGAGALLIALGGVFAIEVLGRQSTSDLYDLLAVTALIPFGLLLAAKHQRSAVPGIAALAEFGKKLLAVGKSATFQMGLDFRGSPPVKHGAPPLVKWAIAILAMTNVLAFALATHLPHGLRTGLIRVSYVGYLVLLVALWVALAAAILLSAFLPLALIHDSFIARHRGRGRRSRRAEMLAVAAWFSFLFCIGYFVQLRWAVIAGFALMAVYLLGAMPARKFAVQFLWRPPESIRVRALSWSQWVSLEFLLIGLAVLALTQIACGSLIWNDVDVSHIMPVTTLLGYALAWLGPGLLALLCVQMAVGRYRDPSRPAKPTAHVTLHPGTGSRLAIAKLFAARGWRVRFAPIRPRPLDVRIELVAAKLNTETQPDRWPMVATQSDLDGEGTFVRLARRDEIQKRRAFLTGLESLLKLAKVRASSGCGFWLSPHFWFVNGLMRDSRPSDEGDDFDLRDDPILSGSAGPPYHRVFARAVRRHLYEVFRGTQVDLIFIEDGVSFKRLRRVLRALFEVYDVHAGRRPAEEIDFRGLPGVRAIIHEYQFDEPFQSRTYPEPKYEFLGRARILHVFRDRGGQEELLEAPYDFDRQPAPVMAY